MPSDNSIERRIDAAPREAARRGDHTTEAALTRLLMAVREFRSAVSEIALHGSADASHLVDAVRQALPSLSGI